MDLPAPELSDEQLANAAPKVRAELVTRLNRLWRRVEPFLDEDVRPDPRMLELGLRVCDRLAVIYRLGLPVAGTGGGAIEGPSPRELVSAALMELEARQGG